MQCETTPQEELAVLNWLDEDQANQHEMDRLDEIFNAKSGSENLAGKGLTCIYNKRTPQGHNPNFLTFEKEAK